MTATLHERNGGVEADLLNLIDAVREEAEPSLKAAKTERQLRLEEALAARERALTSNESLLCNYLPMVRDYLRQAGSAVVDDVSMEVAKADEEQMGDGYVFDVYCVDDTATAQGQAWLDSSEQLAQYHGVMTIERFAEDLVPENEYEADDDISEDSNDAEHPRNNYPDEDEGESVELSSDEGEWEYDPGLRPDRDYQRFAYAGGDESD